MLRVRRERLRRGWSQTYVCRVTGIHPGNLSRVERGQVVAYPGWRKKLGDLYGVPGDELFREVGDDGAAETHRGQ